MEFAQEKNTLSWYSITNYKYSPWKWQHTKRQWCRKRYNITIGRQGVLILHECLCRLGLQTTQLGESPNRKAYCLNLSPLASHKAPGSNRLKTKPNHHTVPLTCALFGCASGQSGMILARRQIQLLILSRLLRSTSLCVTLRFSSLVVPVRRWLIILSLVLGVRLRGAVLVSTSLMT